jgi:hypothetical protein
MPSTFVEIGSTGLKQHAGFVREEFLRELQGQRGMAKYREIGDNDDIAGACLFAIEQLAGQVDWSVEPPEASTEGPETRTKPKTAKAFPPPKAGKPPTPKAMPKPDKPELDERGEFLRTALFEDMDRPFRETVREAFSMLQYGYAPMELVYKRRIPRNGDPALSSRFDDGRIGWDKWAIRSQETIYRWLFDDDGVWYGLEQQAEGFDPVTIHQEKLLVFRAGQRRGNPEGRSIMRPAYTSWYFKKRIKEIEGIGVERDLSGIPVLTAPEGEDWWNTQDVNAGTKLAYAQKMVTSIRNDEQAGIVLPFGSTLELLGSANAGKKIDTNQIITRYDQRIAMTMLADFILIGHEQVGSKALADTKLDAFTLALTSFLDHIEDIVNRVAVPRLWKLNGWPLENMPRVKHGKVAKVDLVALGDFLQKSSAAGLPLFPNVSLEEHLHNVAEFPPPPEGFEARAEALEIAEQESLQQEADQMDLDRELQRELTNVKVGAKPAKAPAKPRTRKRDEPAG